MARVSLPATATAVAAAQQLTGAGHTRLRRWIDTLAPALVPGDPPDRAARPGVHDLGHRKLDHCRTHLLGRAAVSGDRRRRIRRRARRDDRSLRPARPGYQPRLLPRLPPRWWRRWLGCPAWAPLRRRWPFPSSPASRSPTRWYGSPSTFPVARAARGWCWSRWWPPLRWAWCSRWATPRRCSARSRRGRWSESCSGSGCSPVPAAPRPGWCAPPRRR